VVVLVIVCALVPATIRVLHRRRRFTAVAAGGPEAAAAGWQELLAESADRGVPSPPSDTVRGAGRRLVREHRLGQEAQQALRTVIAAVESSWYGGGHPEPDELTGPIRTIRAGIVAGTALSVRSRLLPGSVLRRSRGRHDQGDLPDTETAALRT
jgi:hypothetical protein